MGRRVDLLYGKTGLEIELPDDVDATVIEKPSMPIESNPSQAVAAALDAPVGCAPLDTLARGHRSACILICDVTRPVPNHLFLRPMIERLLDAGIGADNIVVLVATGLHRPNEGAELDALINDPWVQGNVRVENHFARNSDDHVDLGFTANRRTPVKLDRRFVDADVKIASGLVEPHFMAGYSGGRKVVAPGVAHEDTIRTFHSARFMEDPGAVMCNLDGNPLHEEQLEIMGMLGPVYALNTVIDDARRLSFVNFGEITLSHARAVAFVHDFAAVDVARRYQTVVTSAAGFPLDQTYYQTVKAMVTPLDILAEGATLIVAADCSEGLGSAAFRASQRRLLDEGAEQFLTRILAKRFADIDEWQTEMLLKPRRLANIELYSRGLGADDFRLSGVNRIGSVRDAIERSVAASGDHAVAVIPEGPYVVPRHAA